MNIRIYSHKHQLYTNSPLWPSNQLTCSEWALSPKGEVIEMIYGDDSGFCSVETHDKRNFAVEPWTGFFDSAGKKIYRGDILVMKSMFDFVSEVEWKNGAFWLKAIDSEGFDQQFDDALTRFWTIEKNIHNAEYSD